jgi:hypothetical protein
MKMKTAATGAITRRPAAMIIPQSTSSAIVVSGKLRNRLASFRLAHQVLIVTFFLADASAIVQSLPDGSGNISAPLGRYS